MHAAIDVHPPQSPEVLGSLERSARGQLGVDPAAPNDKPLPFDADVTPERPRQTVDTVALNLNRRIGKRYIGYGCDQAACIARGDPAVGGKHRKRLEPLSGKEHPVRTTRAGRPEPTASD